MNNDLQKNVTLNIGVNRQNLQGAIDGSRQVQTASDNVARSFTALVRSGRDLREMGTVMAAGGAAIIAPLVASANEYVKRFGMLEQTGRDFLAAQQKQSDAVASFGRVAAQALTPIMNQAAEFTQKVADFAAAHPELLQAAVGIGGGLAAGGAALIAAGTAITTVARSADLLKNALGGGGALGGLTSTIGTAVVSVAALAAGAQLGVTAVQAVGKATNNEALAHYQLTDALKTAREILGAALLGLAKDFIDAKKAWGDLMDIMTGVFNKVNVGFQGVMDQLGTGVAIGLKLLQNGIAQFLNGILESAATLATNLNQPALAQSLIGARDNNAISIGSKTGYQSQADQMAVDLASRDKSRGDYLSTLGGQLSASGAARNNQYATDQGNLANFAKTVGNFVSTGSLGSVVDNLLGGIGQKIQSAIGSFTSPSSGKGITTNGTGVSPEEVNAYIDFRKQEAAADLQYTQQAKQITTSFNAEEAKAKQDHADQMLQLQQQEQQAETDLLTKYNQDKAKAQSDFNFSQSQTDAKEAFDRTQRLRAYTFQAQDLAAQRDVAGFVQNLRQFNFNEAQTTRQENFDSQQRQQTFQNEQNDKAIQYQQDLAQLQLQDRRKVDEANKQFANEERDRKTAYQQQLTDLKTKHQQEDTLIEQHFAEQLASLQGNIAGLQTIQATYYSQSATDAQNFVNNQRAILQQLYSQSIGVASGASGGSATPPPPPSYSNPVYTPSAPSYTAPVVNAPYIPTVHFNGAGFASGLPYVPTEGLYHLHPAERVLNSREAAAYNNGGGGGMNVAVSIGSVGGDITQAHLANLERSIYQGVARGIAEGKARVS